MIMVHERKLTGKCAVCGAPIKGYHRVCKDCFMLGAR